MITFILLIVGFLTGGALLGESIINAFELTQYWLWFLAILATIIAVIVNIVFIISGSLIAKEHKLNKFLVISGGGLFGIIMSIFILATTYVNLWLSYYIIENTPSTVTLVSELPNNTLYAIFAFIFITVLGVLGKLGKSK